MKSAATITNMHGFIIKVYNGPYPSSGIKDVLRWDGMRFELMTKYNWYFNYRAALAQVENPKCHVYATPFTEPASGKTLEQVVQNRIVAKKRKITEYRNKLKKAEDSWDELFPIESDERYQWTVAKIGKLEIELEQMKREIENV